MNKAKRKYISEELTNSKKICYENVKEVSNFGKDCTITEVINLGIPHVGEQIFSCLDTEDLIQCLEVSKTWTILIEPVLLQRYKGKIKDKIFEACKDGKTAVVKILLANLKGRKTELNNL